MSTPPAPESFYWYDYETTGTSYWYDRPLQFGGLRTDAELNPLEEPLEIYCCPAADVLPDPEACLITGITPQLAQERGLPEHAFAKRVHEELSRPGTCGVGYNSIRFDDEFTRHLLYRNFYDPYAREWQDGNSRWDLLNVMRLCRALRPDGIEWAEDEEGVPSFKLERLARANGIDVSQAHNALADVRMTLGLARLVRSQQARLFDYTLALRNKRHADALLEGSIGRKAVLHVSNFYGNDRCCTAPVLPLVREPERKQSVIVFNLNADPEPLLGLGDSELREAVAARKEWGSLGLQTIILNQCPVFAPLSILKNNEAAEERIGMNQALCDERISRLQGEKRLAERVAAALSEGPEREQPKDPERLLYGGFFQDADRALCKKVRETTPLNLAGSEFRFQDSRLPEMLFRYRARNFPDTLTPEEHARWEEYRYRRLTEAEGEVPLLLEEYLERIAALKEQLGEDREQQLLSALEDWADEVVAA